MATITDVCYLVAHPKKGYITLDDIEYVEDIELKDLEESEYTLEDMDRADYADFADPRYNSKWDEDYGWNDDDIYRLVVINDESTYQQALRRKIEREVRMRLCKTLKRARTGKEMSQMELSEKSGVARSNIARIEGGNLNTGLDTIIKLCEALDCELEVIQK